MFNRNAIAILAILAMIVLSCAALLTGCANPTTATLNAQGVVTGTQVANSAYFTDKEWVANFQGITPTHAMIDKDGVHVQTGGLGTAMNAAGIVGMWSPKDVRITNIEIISKPDGSIEFKADLIETVITNAIGAYTAQVQAVVSATENMTRIEAERYVQALEASGKITTDIAQMLRNIYLPSIP